MLGRHGCSDQGGWNPRVRDSGEAARHQTAWRGLQRVGRAWQAFGAEASDGHLPL